MKRETSFFRKDGVTGMISIATWRGNFLSMSQFPALIDLSADDLVAKVNAGEFPQPDASWVPVKLSPAEAAQHSAQSENAKLQIAQRGAAAATGKRAGK